MTKQEFDRYVYEHGPDILRFCKMTTASEVEGEELYQDTMVKLLEQLNKLDLSRNLKSYILSVAIYLWKNKRRKFAWRKRLAPFESYEAHLESGGMLPVSSSEEIPENQVLQKEKVEMVRNLVSELSEKYRTPIYLFYSADMKIAEIADCLNLSENTVKSRLRRAKNILKKKLEVAYYE
ncbi:MAG: sigma-70 family RNA polymerase sigma factor [Eubacterium sp.]|nr:sigma-70 family RNA polymerase sigma factor [Eubacterium sp.]MDY3774753.1 sigma-70 family RNA polymerase sigma factor [Eubacterium sp.]